MGSVRCPIPSRRNWTYWHWSSSTHTRSGLIACSSSSSGPSPSLSLSLLNAAALQRSKKSPFAIFKKKTIGPLSLGIYAAGPQVLVYRTQFLELLNAAALQSLFARDKSKKKEKNYWPFISGYICPGPPSFYLPNPIFGAAQSNCAAEFLFACSIKDRNKMWRITVKWTLVWILQANDRIHVGVYNKGSVTVACPCIYFKKMWHITVT